MNVQLIVNDQMFPVHYQLLLTIAKTVPEGAHYGKLVKAFVALGMPA